MSHCHAERCCSDVSHPTLAPHNILCTSSLPLMHPYYERTNGFRSTHRSSQLFDSVLLPIHASRRSLENQVHREGERDMFIKQTYSAYRSDDFPEDMNQDGSLPNSAGASTAEKKKKPRKWHLSEFSTICFISIWGPWCTHITGGVHRLCFWNFSLTVVGVSFYFDIRFEAHDMRFAAFWPVTTLASPATPRIHVVQLHFNAQTLFFNTFPGFHFDTAFPTGAFLFTFYLCFYSVTLRLALLVIFFIPLNFSRLIYHITTDISMITNVSFAWRRRLFHQINGRQFEHHRLYT